MEIETRRCTNPECDRAGVELPLSEFNKGRKRCKYCDRKCAKENRDKKWKKCRRIINRYLGEKCVVCGEQRERRLRCHEIYGKPHEKLLDTPLEEVEANCKTGRFARVCARCHGKAHALMDKGMVSWDIIQFYIKEFMESDPPIETDAHLRAWHKWMRDNIQDRQLRLPIEVEEVPKVKETPKVERAIFTSDKEAEQAFAGAEAII